MDMKKDAREYTFLHRLKHLLADFIIRQWIREWHQCAHRPDHELGLLIHHGDVHLNIAVFIVCFDYLGNNGIDLV